MVSHALSSTITNFCKFNTKKMSPIKSEAVRSLHIIHNTPICCFNHPQHTYMLLQSSTTHLYAASIIYNTPICCFNHPQHTYMLLQSSTTHLYAASIIYNTPVCCFNHLQHTCMLLQSSTTHLYAASLSRSCPSNFNIFCFNP